jgi:hypothetical protein
MRPIRRPRSPRPNQCSKGRGRECGCNNGKSVDAGKEPIRSSLLHTRGAKVGWIRSCIEVKDGEKVSLVKIDHYAGTKK